MLKKILFILINCLLFFSCNYMGKKESNSCRHIVKVQRYDRLQYEYIAFNSLTALQKMNTDYPQITKLLIEDVLQLGTVEDSFINDKMISYYRDTTLMKIMYDAENKYKDLSGIEKKMNDGFNKLIKEVPSIRKPYVYSQISALNQSVVVDDSIIGISLDKYMGADYPLYKKMYYSSQSRSMSEERIVPDCLTYYLLSEYPFLKNSKECPYNFMMHCGKICWVVSNILGYKSLEEELGYNKLEIKWCRENEERVFAELKNKTLYFSDEPNSVKGNMQHVNFITKSFNNNPPPYLSTWMGMKLVDKYMKSDKRLTINDLLKDNDYKKMLSKIDINI